MLVNIWHWCPPTAGGWGSQCRCYISESLQYMLLLKVIECWWLSLLFILHLVFVNGWSLFPLHSPGARSELFITLLLGHFSILFRLIQLVIMEKVLNAYEHIIYISYIWFAATLDWQPCECPYFGTSERTLVSLLLFYPGNELTILSISGSSITLKNLRIVTEVPWDNLGQVCNSWQVALTGQPCHTPLSFPRNKSTSAMVLCWCLQGSTEPYPQGG